MDVSAATNKISDIVLKINEYYEKIKSIYNNFANKINEYINELEKVLNKLNETSSQSIIWAEMQIKKILKKISDTLIAAKNKINNIIKQVEIWYENTIKKIKISIIKGSMAKIGVSLTDVAAEGMSSIIPHPDVKILIPEIHIDLQLPELAFKSKSNLDFLNSIELKKLLLL